jgi:hypothetical protein
MATESQINANRQNSQNSTGPRTDAGRTIVSQNAVSTGLFSKNNFVRPNELERYNALHDSLHADLAPLGALEENLAIEIIRASWRLERCNAVEAGFTTECPDTDPMASGNFVDQQNSVDRARAHSHRILMRTLAELRRIQTERFARRELRDDVGRNINGVASSLQLAKALNSAKSKIAKQTQSPASNNSTIGRNSLCPCNSGQKYKRCCGNGARVPLVTRAA